MNRTSMNAAARAALVSFSILGAAFVSGGCVYRPNIQQGNLLEVEDVEQVTVGMTRSQVRYVLGTPMLADPFDPQRWDYIYTFRRGRGSKIDRSHFVVHFDGDKVSKVEKLDLPDGANDPKKKKKQASSDATREPPTLPSIDQPQPDAPRPGNDS
jgi:outer membrane protein assembly factor BamE